MTYKQTASRVGVCYLFLMVITGILQVAASVVISVLAPQLYQTSWCVWVISYVPLYCVAVPLFLLVGRALLPNAAPLPAGDRPMTPKWWLSTFLLCLGITYLFNILSNLLLTGIGMLKGTPAQNTLQTMVDASSLGWNFLFGCIVAPVGEELIFRKWLYRRLAPFGDKAYVLLGGAVFGMFHGNLGQLFYAVALGCVFCWLYLHTGSIRVTIGLHMAVNTVGMLLMPALALTETGALVAGVLMLVFIAAGAVLAVRGFGRLSWQRGENAPARPLSALATPGMGAYLAVCLALVVISLFTTELSALTA